MEQARDNMNAGDYKAGNGSMETLANGILSENVLVNDSSKEGKMRMLMASWLLSAECCLELADYDKCQGFLDDVLKFAKKLQSKRKDTGSKVMGLQALAACASLRCSQERFKEAEALFTEVGVL